LVGGWRNRRVLCRSDRRCGPCLRALAVAPSSASAPDTAHHTESNDATCSTASSTSTNWPHNRGDSAECPSFRTPRGHHAVRISTLSINPIHKERYATRGRVACSGESIRHRSGTTSHVPHDPNEPARLTHAVPRRERDPLGIEMGGTWLEPVTPSLSRRGGRSDPFTPVRSTRLVTEVAVPRPEPVRTRANATCSHCSHQGLM
jgi:hypothetical protein